MRSENINRKDIIKELLKSIPELDDKGLAFVYKQVKLIIHNMQIDKFNIQIEKQNKKIVENRKKGKTESKKQSNKKVNLIVEVENIGNNFVIKINNQRKHFSLGEFRKLVNISHISKNQTEGTEMLFRWLRKERSDVLNDAGITTNKSKALIELRKVLKNNFKNKK